MPRRTRCLLACLPIMCTLVALPAAAIARAPRGSSGGGGLGAGGGSTTTTGSSTTPVASGNPFSTATPAVNVITLGGVLNASGDGITLTVAASGTLGQPLAITGSAAGSDTGATIAIESAKAGHGDWTRVASATVASNGAFAAHWTPTANGQLALRAVLAPTVAAGSTTGAGGLSGSAKAAAAGELSTSAVTIPIFKNAIATVYGPGFWGHHTACGERLRHATLGVASRTLKCGTQVAVLYQGREITVPVIDRGPFANGASWDLTMATAKALGIKETVTIGTLTSAVAPTFTTHS